MDKIRVKWGRLGEEGLWDLQRYVCAWTLWEEGCSRCSVAEQEMRLGNWIWRGDSGECLPLAYLFPWPA